MLSLVLSLFSPDVEACSPGTAAFTDSVPTFDNLEVPVDSIVRIELAGGYLFGEPEVFLRQGTEKLAVEVAVHKRTLDATEEHVVLEVTPLDELQPSLEYTVELSQSNGDLTEVTRFVVAEARSAEVDVAPSLAWIDHIFVPVLSDEASSCNATDRTELYFDLSYGEPRPEYSLHLYRIDPTLVHGGQEIGKAHLEERFHTVLAHQEYSSLSTVISNTSAEEEYCFVARYANEAGVEGPISSAVCSVNVDDHDFKCGTAHPFGLIGCSNLGARAAGFFAMMMSVFGLVRRRRR